MSLAALSIRKPIFICNCVLFVHLIKKGKVTFRGVNMHSNAFVLVSFPRDTFAAKGRADFAVDQHSFSSECLRSDLQYGRAGWPGGVKLSLKNR